MTWIIVIARCAQPSPKRCRHGPDMRSRSFTQTTRQGLRSRPKWTVSSCNAQIPCCCVQVKESAMHCAAPIFTFNSLLWGISPLLSYSGTVLLCVHFVVVSRRRRHALIMIHSGAALLLKIQGYNCGWTGKSTWRWTLLCRFTDLNYYHGHKVFFCQCLI